ncbi:MAG: hypothetical protein HRU38_15700 [Saccharospirillaceae bacterium]|nr:hypothetical protein [Pseudomonadales bacterium]NRB80085.1 hypothetical protein [Saccharospirillaceae bacterium]
MSRRQSGGIIPLIIIVMVFLNFEKIVNNISVIIFGGVILIGGGYFLKGAFYLTKREMFFSEVRNAVKKYKGTLSSKKKELVVNDDYGDVDKFMWEHEIKNFIESKVFKFIDVEKYLSKDDVIKYVDSIVYSGDKINEIDFKEGSKLKIDEFYLDVSNKVEKYKVILTSKKSMY